jgi:Heterokaryon incompatibility protein (HET)
MSSSTSKRVDDFPYPPLPQSEDAIRILTISPGDFFDPICCILATATFVNRPKYAALSYTWEPPFPDGMVLPTSPGETLDAETRYQTRITSSTSTHSSKNTINSPDTEETKGLSIINVNSTAMAIQHNLCLAILHLRSPTHTLDLWVDAVCINQKDKIEVSSQVSLMSLIYSRAQTVVAWLGPKESKSHIDMFHHMSNVWKMGQSRYLGAALAQEKSSLISRDPEPNAVARIAGSTYWTRLWIVQEVCLAKDLTFAYGTDVWTFDSFVNCKTVKDIQIALDNDVATLDESHAEFRAMLRLLDCRKRRYSVRSSLETLIEAFRKHSSGKVMDRIYGLLGMAYDVYPISSSNSIADPTDAYLNSLDLEQEKIVEPARGRGVLKIDYSSSLYKLWADVVKFVFFRAKSLQLKNKLGKNQYFQDQERRISIVRTAGVIQAALDQKVEDDMPLMPKESVCISAFQREH